MTDNNNINDIPEAASADNQPDKKGSPAPEASPDSGKPKMEVASAQELQKTRELITTLDIKISNVSKAIKNLESSCNTISRNNDKLKADFTILNSKLNVLKLTVDQLTNDMNQNFDIMVKKDDEINKTFIDSKGDKIYRKIDDIYSKIDKVDTHLLNKQFYNLISIFQKIDSKLNFIQIISIPFLTLIIFLYTLLFFLFKKI